MFKMRNAIGNAILIAKSERKRAALKELGFIEVESVEKAPITNLDKMKVSELETLAESNGIDLSDCKNREEKISKIRESINYK